MIYEDQGFDQMAKDVVSYMEARYPGYNGSFKVYTRRAKKSYPITSMEVSAAIGEKILDAFPDASVDVHNPEMTLSVEIRDKIYVYSETLPDQVVCRLEQMVRQCFFFPVELIVRLLVI